jgi:hypothetical protein
MSTKRREAELEVIRAAREFAGMHAVDNSGYWKWQVIRAVEALRKLGPEDES